MFSCQTTVYHTNRQQHGRQVGLNCSTTGRMEQAAWSPSDYLDEESKVTSSLTSSHRLKPSTGLYTGHNGRCWLWVVLCTPVVQDRNSDADDKIYAIYMAANVLKKATFAYNQCSNSLTIYTHFSQHNTFNSSATRVINEQMKTV